MLDPNQIREARYALSLSQHELARRAGVSRTALNQFEQGIYQAGPSFCRKLRDFLETKGIHLESVAQSHTESQLARVALQRPLPQAAAEINVSAPNKGGALEDMQCTIPTPIEILLGVGLSLLLGRKIGM